jgi:choline dehydrogenase-like flavoprotein
MILFGDNLADGSNLVYDICVIGSGISALSLVHALTVRRRGSPLRIVLLEGGRTPPIYPPLSEEQTSISRIHHELSSDVQHLYKGHVKGWIAESMPDYLTESRLRGIGGSSWVWSGWWLPLECRDLSYQLERPDTAWPISMEELHQYYLRAHDLAGLGRFKYDDVSYWTSQGATPIGGSDLRVRMLILKRVNFWHLLEDEIRNSKHTDICLNANVTGLEFSRRSTKVELASVVATTIEKAEPARNIRVSARVFVLAAGAIESTRILLNAGLGSSSNQLGLNFVEHPYLWTAARFQISANDSIRRFYFSERPIPTGNSVYTLPILVPTVSFLDQHRTGSFRLLLGGTQDTPGTINMCWEQFPCSENRISLACDQAPDIFGLPKVKLESYLNEMDFLTVQHGLEAAQATLERLGWGRRFILPNRISPTIPSDRLGHVTPGNHPMGITKMSDSPESGVVNQHLCLHESNNCYVLSTGVFPSGGYANPVLTLVALSARLANHLESL